MAETIQSYQAASGPGHAPTCAGNLIRENENQWYITRGLDTYNRLFPENKIDTSRLSELMRIVSGQGGKSGGSYSIISGVNYGSSLVGMAHTINRSEARASNKNKTQNVPQFQTDMIDMMNLALWLEGAQGGIGANQDIVNNIKDLLSNQMAFSHISLISMGGIPSIASNKAGALASSVSQQNQDSQSDPLGGGSSYGQDLSGGDGINPQTFAAGEQNARDIATATAAKSATTNGLINELASIDRIDNKTLDVNSLMTAFENYVQDARAGKVRVPISFYTKQVSARSLTRQWLQKNLPQGNKSSSVQGTVNPAQQQNGSDLTQQQDIDPTQS